MEGDDKVIVGLSLAAAEHLAEEWEATQHTCEGCDLCEEIDAEVKAALAAAKEADESP